MTWLAIWWLGPGLADLVEAVSGRRARWWATGAGIGAQLAVAALTLTFTAANLLAVALCVVGCASWRLWHEGCPLRPTAWRAWVVAGSGRPRFGLGGLAVILGGTALAVACSPMSSAAAGPMADWLGAIPLLGLPSSDPTHALAGATALLLNLASGNVIVRDALVAAGVSAAAQAPATPGPQPLRHPRLRGGRVLGPMERVLILGFGAAGQLAAAGLVVAAKGLVRFPELNATAKDPAAPRIDEVTEYFLIGTFASVLLALGTLALVA